MEIHYNKDKSLESHYKKFELLGSFLVNDGMVKRTVTP